MRRCYLVCYDIRDPKRLRRVHKVMKGYGEAWQYSVFFCVLKDIELVRMRANLEEEMNLRVDLVMILDLGENEKQARDAALVLGPSLPEVDEGIVVV